METFAPSSALQELSIADLRDYGHRFGIDYRFPGLGGQMPGSTVLRGQVQELPLSSGLHLSHSGLEVLRPYETLSTGNTACFLLVVLEGCVQLRMAGEHFAAKAGTAITTHLNQHSVLHAIHAPNQYLKTLTLALDTSPQAAQPHGLFDDFPRPAQASTHFWQLPRHLHQALHQALQHRHSAPMSALQRRLLLEGMALQLLAYGMQAPDCARTVALSPGERQRLEAIGQQLGRDPGRDYPIAQLAQQAAMSTSSFRSKFRQMYGVPVSDYLRERRLALARQYLLQGYSVQQAAERCGYGHASNFATAFRKHYGMAPSSLG